MKTKRKFMKDQNSRLPKGLHAALVRDIQSALSQLPYYGPKVEVLAEELLAKYCELDLGQAMERRSAAILKWLAVETHNSRTNKRFINKRVEKARIEWFVHESGRPLTSQEHLRGFYVNPYKGFRAVDDGLLSQRVSADLESVSMSVILDEAAGFIRRAIGANPSRHIGYCRYSGGATTSRKRIDAYPASKYLGKVHVTRDAMPIWEDSVRGTAIGRHYDARDLDVTYVPGNVLFTVPKNAEIDRVCCKEPDLNIFLQKGIGSQLRWLLRRQGIDLNDQSKNQKLAREGSIDNVLCTIDLSSASDTVARELVRRLVPSDWYHTMDAIRSKTTQIPELGFDSMDPSARTSGSNSTVNLEMFSSMGNGFTFELESLIFWSLARATQKVVGGIRGSISVYGDDIIVPIGIYSPFTSVLKQCGFRVNSEKSFHGNSPYRESCGAHWYAGMDVKPFYIRKETSTLIDLMHVLNQMILWDTRHDKHCAVDPCIQEVWEKYAHYVPQDLWGGQDLNDPTSLVSGHAPRKRLVPVIRGRHVADDAKYVSFLHTTEWRNPAYESINSFGPSVVTERCRKRANRQWAGELPLFLGREI